jgi:hypothetical protein
MLSMDDPDGGPKLRNLGTTWYYRLAALNALGVLALAAVLTRLPFPATEPAGGLFGL